MNTFPIFAEIPEMHKREKKNFLVLNPNLTHGGYDLYYIEDFKKPYLEKDWSFELEDAFIAAESEYGITKNMWKKMK